VVSSTHQPHFTPWKDPVPIVQDYFYYILVITKEKRNILHTIKKGKASWIVRVLHRNFVLVVVITGKVKGRIRVTGRRGRRSKQLLDDLERKKEDT